MYWQSLNKFDVSLYKGIAILMIVTHNFMHIFPKPKQNEFNFHQDRFFDFIYLLLNEPENIIRDSLSFFGHFGVQIFIFLSAYGLAKKYCSNSPTYWLFIWQRAVKIYPAFILSIFTWALISGWVMGINDTFSFLEPIKILYWNMEALMMKLLLLSNFPGGEPLAPLGPWWFIPFIFQFYFIFPFLFYLYSKFGGSILLILCTFSIVLSIFTKGQINDFNIYFTILGHLPEFCLCIYLAGKDKSTLRIPRLIILLAFIIYILGNIYEIFWYVTHISFLILLLVALTYLVPKIKKNRILQRVFLFLGGISMPLFLVNGFLRHPFILWAKDQNHWLYTIFLCLVSLVISVLVAFVLFKIENRLMLKIKADSPATFYNQLKTFILKRTY